MLLSFSIFAATTRGEFSFFTLNLTGGAGTRHGDAFHLPAWAHELSSFNREQ